MRPQYLNDKLNLKQNSNAPLVYNGKMYLNTKKGIKQLVEDHKKSEKINGTIGRYKGFDLSSYFNEARIDNLLIFCYNYMC